MFHIDQAYAEAPCKASTLYSMVIPDEGRQYLLRRL
jgi:hypothetical protein